MSSLRQFFESIEEKMDPVVRWEWKRQFSRHAVYVSRVLTSVVIAGILIGTLMYSYSDKSNLTFGKISFNTRVLEGILLLFGMFGGFFSAWSSLLSATFFPEKDSKALFFLLSTPVSSTYLVLSKLLPSWWKSFSVTLLPLPVFAAAEMLGGWKLLEILLTYLVVAVVFLDTKLNAIRGSIRSRTLKEVRNSTSSLAGFLPFFVIMSNQITPMLNTSYPALMSALEGAWDHWWVQALTFFLLAAYEIGMILPLLSVLSVPLPFRIHDPLWMLTLAIAGGLGFLLLKLRGAVRDLRPIALSQMMGDPIPQSSLMNRIDAFFRRIRPAAWEAYPLAWRHLFIGRKSLVRRSVTLPLLVLVAAIAYLALAYSRVVSLPFGNQLETLTPAYFLYAIFGTAVAISASATEMMKREHQTQTWSLILTIPRSNREIVKDVAIAFGLTLMGQLLILAIGVMLFLLLVSVPLNGMVALIIIVINWWGMGVMLATTAMVNVNGDAKRPWRTYWWGIDVVILIVLVAALLFALTLTIAEAWSNSTSFQNPGASVPPSLADGLTATGLIWCWQTKVSGEFAWRMLLGIPSIFIYAMIYRWFWPRCVRRFGVVNERRD